MAPGPRTRFAAHAQAVLAQGAEEACQGNLRHEASLSIVSPWTRLLQCPGLFQHAKAHQSCPIGASVVCERRGRNDYGRTPNASAMLAILVQHMMGARLVEPMLQLSSGHGSHLASARDTLALSSDARVARVASPPFHGVTDIGCGVYAASFEHGVGRTGARGGQ